jgi:predicted Rossmann fold nucleotide-binding protein DprA/Smf involved in DNA uptake
MRSPFKKVKKLKVMMQVVNLSKNAPEYPPSLALYLGNQAPENIACLGNINVLNNKKLSLFCSVKCPGNLILQTYDLARNLRQEGTAVISGFHSPMEQECLKILLRGTQPVIVCPARSIYGMRLKKEFKQPLADGRLLLLSPFTKDKHRVTTENAIIRNRFVAAVADSIFVAHAASGSKMEQFYREIIAWRKSLYMLEDAANDYQISLGAIPVRSDSKSQWA